MQQSYSTLHLTVTDGVAEIVLDNPPVNVISAMLMTDLGSALGDLREDHSTKVIVFSSANPDFFLAHVDMHILDDEDLLTEIADAAPEGVNVFQSVGELLRNQPQPVIVKLAGTARHGAAVPSS